MKQSVERFGNSDLLYNQPNCSFALRLSFSQHLFQHRQITRIFLKSNFKYNNWDCAERCTTRCKVRIYINAYIRRRGLIIYSTAILGLAAQANVFLSCSYVSLFADPWVTSSARILVRIFSSCCVELRERREYFSNILEFRYIFKAHNFLSVLHIHGELWIKIIALNKAIHIFRNFHDFYWNFFPHNQKKNVNKNVIRFYHGFEPLSKLFCLFTLVFLSFRQRVGSNFFGWIN